MQQINYFNNGKTIVIVIFFSSIDSQLNKTKITLK